MEKLTEDEIKKKLAEYAEKRKKSKDPNIHLSVEVYEKFLRGQDEDELEAEIPEEKGETIELTEDEMSQLKANRKIEEIQQKKLKILDKMEETLTKINTPENTFLDNIAKDPEFVRILANVSFWMLKVKKGWKLTMTATNDGEIFNYKFDLVDEDGTEVSPEELTTIYGEEGKDNAPS